MSIIYAILLSFDFDGNIPHLQRNATVPRCLQHGTRRVSAPCWVYA